MWQSISRRALAFAAGGALYLATAAGMAQQPAPGAQIVIDNFAFAPATLTVAAGTEVTWLNRDEEPHTVMSVDPALPFKSAALDTNDKFTFTFAKPGTFKYFCSIHSHMVGTIVVK
jgi:plastocyanin